MFGCPERDRGTVREMKGRRCLRAISATMRDVEVYPGLFGVAMVARGVVVEAAEVLTKGLLGEVCAKRGLRRIGQIGCGDAFRSPRRNRGWVSRQSMHVVNRPYMTGATRRSKHGAH